MIYIHTYHSQAIQSLYFFFWGWKVEIFVNMQANNKGKQPMTQVKSLWQHWLSWIQNEWQYTCKVFPQRLYLVL